MIDPDTRIDDLLNSVVGCAFLVALDETGLTPDDAADPKVSLRMAAACANFVFRYNSNYDVVAPGILALAKGKVDQPRALIENPHTAWWFHDVDLDRQAWLSIQGSPDEFIYGIPPNTTGWRQPENPSRGWELYAQKPRGNQTTSTLYGPYLTSNLLAYDEGTGDHICPFPLAWWAVHFPEDVRVFEIHGPSDWHDLCVQYPSRSTKDNRLVPNWGAVSEEWDGVHLSFGGLLTSEQNRYESPDGWTMLDFWHSEQTYWLRGMKTETKRLPDFDRGLGPPTIHGLRFPGFGEEPGTLLRS